MIRNIITRIKGGNTNSVAITKPSSYKPPVPSPAVKAAQAKVDARYKADVKAGTPAARTARMKARIAAMKEEALQIDEDALKARQEWMKAKGVSTGKPKADRARKVKRLMQTFPMKKEEVELDEANARHSFTAAQQVLTPRKKDILNASSTNPRAKAAAVKYARRVAKISPDYSKKDVTAHLRSMRDEVNEGAEYIEERLKASDPTSKWISDFVHSDNPRFKGKTKKERINMALGAYYAKKKGVSEAKLDPVGQEDADVNNDGIKGHSTDKYLMKRRAAISQAIKNKK